MKIGGGSKFFDKVLDITGSFMFLIEGELEVDIQLLNYLGRWNLAKKTYIHENKMNIVWLAWLWLGLGANFALLLGIFG